MGDIHFPPKREPQFLLERNPISYDDKNPPKIIWNAMIAEVQGCQMIPSRNHIATGILFDPIGILKNPTILQGYLAHKNPPPPPRTAIGPWA